jgi:hypothetical protein
MGEVGAAGDHSERKDERTCGGMMKNRGKNESMGPWHPCFPLTPRFN